MIYILQKWAALILGIMLVGFCLGSCDAGLSPPPEKGRIEGTIKFRGHWPPQDSVKNLILVLVPGSPTYHVPALISGVTNKLVQFQILKYKSADTNFVFNLDSGSYGYLGVAQQFSDSIFRDWRAVGFAHNARDSALAFEPRLGKVYSGLQIIVNFDSLPWQPFVP